MAYSSTSGIPLNVGKTYRIVTEGIHSPVKALEPLIPEAAGLLEIGNLEDAARLVRESQGGDGCQSFGVESGHVVGSACAPVMAYYCEAFELEGIGEVDSILS